MTLYARLQYQKQYLSPCYLNMFLFQDHDVYKKRLHANGTAINEGEKHEIGPQKVNDEDYKNGTYCGSCFGAGMEGECCNTCEEVDHLISVSSYQSKVSLHHQQSSSHQSFQSSNHWYIPLGKIWEIQLHQCVKLRTGVCTLFCSSFVHTILTFRIMLRDDTWRSKQKI